jgi:trehalose 6-phosphate phosphatase
MLLSYKGVLAMAVAQPVSRSESVDLPSPPLDLPRRAALFLDLDGTLVPIMPRPDDVGPDPRRARLLARLREALEDRVAVVSGRALEDLDHILGGGVTAIAAVHGLVRRGADGVIAAPSRIAGLADARRHPARAGPLRQGPAVRGQGPQRRPALSQRPLPPRR